MKFISRPSPPIMSMPTLFTDIPASGSVYTQNAVTGKSRFGSSILMNPYKKYTYGDAFCGAGGATRGAHMAGLQVKWGFDSNLNACTSWRANFPNASCYKMPSDEFVHLAQPSQANMRPIDVTVDILHLSPPCQFFSPAHTCEGVNDEKMWQACLLYGK